MSPVNSKSTIISNLTVYALAHALVDTISIGILFSIIRHGLVTAGTQLDLTIIYSVVAFGPQLLFGLLIDKIKMPRGAAFTGLLFVAGAAIFYSTFPVIALITAALGNAIFHVGGGSISLNLIPRQATIPGIFVAPGAIGVFLGTLLGKNGNFILWPFALAALILLIAIIYIKKPVTYSTEISQSKINNHNFLGLIIILVLLAVAIRSLIGFLVFFPWKTNIYLSIILTLAIVAGKALGGFLGDKFGWTKIGVGALILSIPLLAFGANYPLLAIPGMILFNMTMPITLVLVSNVLPGRPAFAFGLTCLALIIGALPIYAGWRTTLQNSSIISLTILVSAIMLFLGLHWYQKNQINQSKN